MVSNYLKWPLSLELKRLVGGSTGPISKVKNTNWPKLPTFHLGKVLSSRFESNLGMSLIMEKISYH